MAHMPRGLAASLAGWRARPGTLVWQPPPPAGGDPARARRLARGVLLFEGRLVETGAPVPWDIVPPDRAWSDQLHGHGWLDDAAAAGDPRLWDRFEEWTWAWIDRYATGRGPGWRAELVARRLTRWIAYSTRLLRGRPPERSRAFFRALAAHARYLDWRWREAEGAARIEALGGLVYASLSLEGTPSADRAIRDLGREAGRLVQPDGGIDSRNPEELARILATLNWSAAAIGEAARTPAPGHLDAIRRAAPVVRALTMPGGTLPRFHGGRGGTDLALAELTAGTPAEPPTQDGRVMGYLRLAGGDAALIIDAAPPPSDRHAATAHASALAFEFARGTQPVIVSAGPGFAFGEAAAAEARRAAAHSAVEVGGSCPGTWLSDRGGPARLVTSGSVTARGRRGPDGESLLGESTLYAAALHLTVERCLHLSPDGDRLAGEDTVLATGETARACAAAGLPAEGPPCPMTVRFLLHPEVQAGLVLGGRSVALTLPDGTRWLMRADADRLELLPARYHDESRARPRATMQIVATTDLIRYWGRIEWTLERVGEGARRTPPARAAATP